MVKGIPKSLNPADDNFSHRYAGGVNQYGTKGAQSPENFDGYMNDGMVQKPNAQSPMDLMSNPANPNFGAPVSQGSKLQGIAPENFGPPRISETNMENTSKFGAPGSDNQSFNAQDLMDQGNLQAQNTDLSPPQGEVAKTSDNSSPEKAGNDQKKSKYTYKKVEKMMTEQMIQGAIARMKIKDPDPGVWKQY